MNFFRQHTLRLALVLLTALCHGMWLGAQWHAGGEPSAPKRAVCSCEKFSVPSQSQAMQAAKDTFCPACALSVLAPEVPQAVAPPSIVELQPLPTQSSCVETIQTAYLTLPPQTGPPASEI